MGAVSGSEHVDDSRPYQQLHSRHKVSENHSGSKKSKQFSEHAKELDRHAGGFEQQHRTPVRPTSEKKDYLRELREARLEKSKKKREALGLGLEDDDYTVSNYEAQPWNQYLTNEKYSQKERFDLVREKARMIEENAKRKEQVITLRQRQTTEVDDTLEVNDMLIDAVKAKLAILDQM